MDNLTHRLRTSFSEEVLAQITEKIEDFRAAPLSDSTKNDRLERELLPLLNNDTSLVTEVVISAAEMNLAELQPGAEFYDQPNEEGTPAQSPPPQQQSTTTHHQHQQAIPRMTPSGQQKYNIFVGDLNMDVTEADVREAFGTIGDIESINVIRDRMSGACKGYGFICFTSKEAADLALSEKYRGILVKGRPCRTGPSGGGGQTSHTPVAAEKDTLYLVNFPEMMTEENIEQEVRRRTPDAITVTFKKGTMPGSRFCFVKFASTDLAVEAMRTLSESVFLDRKLTVSWAAPKKNTIQQGQQQQQQQQQMMMPAEPMDEARQRTLYVSKLNPATTDEELRPHFEPFGLLNKCVVVRDPQTNVPKGYGFVEYSDRNNAAQAQQRLDGMTLHGSQISVQFAKPRGPKPQAGGAVGQARGVGIAPVMAGVYGAYGAPAYGQAAAYGAAAAAAAYPGYAAYGQQPYGAYAQAYPGYPPAAYPGYPGYPAYGQAGAAADYSQYYAQAAAAGQAAAYGAAYGAGAAPADYSQYQPGTGYAQQPASGAQRGAPGANQRFNPY